ncbi:MAG: DUF86 domain-containing protein [Ignavibacteriae bacterium]|nr:DUF86 domain-containing protein [Ignavibacteriota bacterium]
MVDEDLVYEKIKNIQNCLKRIRDVTQLDPKSLDDLDTQDIFALNLQRAVQSSLDLALHVVASEGLGLPESLKENFMLLGKAKILSKKETERMVKMVGFRDIAVHEYQILNVKVLKSILRHNLNDLEEFYSTILLHFDLSDS